MPSRKAASIWKGFKTSSKPQDSSGRRHRRAAEYGNWEVLSFGGGRLNSPWIQGDHSSVATVLINYANCNLDAWRRTATLYMNGHFSGWGRQTVQTHSSILSQRENMTVEKAPFFSTFFRSTTCQTESVVKGHIYSLIQQRRRAQVPSAHTWTK